MSIYTIEFNGKEKDEKIIMDTLHVKKSAIILRAVNHKLRQQILKKIDEKGKVTVTEIFTELFLEQAVASQHLAVLRKAGFVKTNRDGKFIYYSVNYSRLKDFLTIIGQLNP
jgi:ArsR family transcriptional regulator, virulence genes transcriptional regulator